MFEAPAHQTTGGREHARACRGLVLGLGGGEMRRKLRSEILESLRERLVVMQHVEIRGDTIVTRWRVSGRNDAGVAALGIGPNGKSVDVTVYTVDRVEGDDMLRTVYLDLTELSRQLEDDRADDARSA
jgi:hypothetical protein